MKLTKYLTALAAACSLLCLATPAGAVTVTVPGQANPWALFGAAPDGGITPVFALNVSAGTTYTYSGTGSVSGAGSLGSSPNPGGLNPAITLTHAAAGGVTGLTANYAALIGVWSTGTAFLMGASGTAVAPAGATALYLGIMDDGVPNGFNNNGGSYSITVNGPASGVPDFGSTLSLMAIGLGLMFAYRKHVLA